MKFSTLVCFSVRQTGTWDPLLQCCNACTWTHLSLSNKIQRNYMGQKITACMHSWGKFWTKDKKRPKNPTANFEEPGAKTVYFVCPLHIPPTREWAKHLSQPSGPTPRHTPTLTLYKERARPPSGSGKLGHRLLVLAPPAAAGAPIKPCLNFLSGLWSVSVD